MSRVSGPSCRQKPIHLELLPHDLDGTSSDLTASRDLTSPLSQKLPGFDGPLPLICAPLHDALFFNEL